MQTIATQPLRVLLGFLAGFSLSILYCRLFFARDPTSYFFDPATYKPIYSLHREAQALDFLSRYAAHPAPVPSIALSPPTICVGVMTVQRQGKAHFPATIGSLLHGLTPSERSQIHLVAFFADTSPSEHASYAAPWLAVLTDQVLTRPNVSHTMTRFAKAADDYSRLLNACYDVGTPNVAIVEDDIIASALWYPSMHRALERLSGDREWLYLRLFYSETFLGWNSEENRTYAMWIARAFGTALVALLLARRGLGMWRGGPKLSWWTIVVVLGVCVPLLCALYFMAGRLSMQPLPRGMIRMDNYGCCAQGLVYAREKVPLVVAELRSLTELLPDQRIEALAGRMQMERWALVPSVFQHVGRISSTGIPKKTWNFQFEVINV